MYRWSGFASRLARQAFAVSRIPLSSKPIWVHSKGSNSTSLDPILRIPHMHFATKGGGRGRPPPNEDDEFDDDSDEEFEDEDLDDTDYEWNYETWNLLHQGKKEGEKSMRRPLPMYKAREMVDFHMIKNRIDGLQVITDPKLEEELRKSLHEGLVDFYKKTQDVFDAIDAEQNKEKEALESNQDKKALGVSGKEETEEKLNIEGEVVGDNSEAVTEGSETQSADEGMQVNQTVTVEVTNGEGKTQLTEESAAVDVELSSLEASLEDAVKKNIASAEAVNEDAVDSDTHAIEEISEEASDDGINVFNYDKWTAFRKEEINTQMAIKAEEQKHRAILRWKTQLVLGPGDAWHPANRKATVSVYVRELGLSKYGKLRLVALAGKRYKSPKDELTIVSERFQHRYENQKDVLRTLLDLIEEARKADKLVDDARKEFMKAKPSSVGAPLKSMGSEATSEQASI